MADVKKLAPFILKWEGGFVNDPDDLGGATNMGVTMATYKVYCKRKGRPEPAIDDLKHLSNDEWIDILKSLYWDKWKADQIKSQSVANILVDWLRETTVSRYHKNCLELQPTALWEKIPLPLSITILHSTNSSTR